MKKVFSIIAVAMALLLGLSSCMKEETRIVFDPSASTAPVIESYEATSDGDVLVTFTPGKMNINGPITYHMLAITSVNGEKVSKKLTTSISGNVAKVTATNLSRALVELKCEDGSKADFTLVVRAAPLKSPEDDQPSAFIDSKEEAEVTDYAVVLPSGDPYARYVDLSEWGLVGSINNWGNPDAEGTVTPDIEMWTNGSLHVAKGVKLSKGDEIKFRKNSSWDLNLGYGEDVTAYELGEEFDLAEGGANIVVAEDGVYDLILDPVSKKATIITSLMPAEDPYAAYTEDSPWSLIGSFNGWGGDVAMVTNGTLHVAKNIHFDAGTEFKFRKDGDWAENFGFAAGVSEYTLDEEFAVEQGGANIVIAESGDYDIFLDPENATARIILTQAVAVDPYAAYTEVSTWSVIGSFNGWGGDVEMVTNGTLHVAKAFAANKGCEFKFRKDADWTVNFGYAAGVSEYTLDEEFAVEQNGANIIILEDGVYDLILDPDNATAKIIKSIAPEAGDTPAPEPKPEVWSLIGTVGGANWDKDIDLTNTNGDIWEIKNVAIGSGEVFKIRADHDWAKSYGGPEANFEMPKAEGGTEGVFKAELGTAFNAGSVNIYIAEAGAYNIIFTYGDAPTILIEEYKEFPDHLYMIGDQFGSWTWTSDDVVELTPVIHNPPHSDAEAQWWTIRYFEAGKGFKFCAKRAWDGDFTGLETNDGYTVDSGNCFVAESGFYMVHIDYKNGKLHIEPARVFLIGDTMGGAWDENLEAGAFSLNTDGSKTLVKELPGAGQLRMYAASSIATSPWWSREFTILDGKIQHRLSGELDWPTVRKAQKVVLDFNAGTGSVEGEGEAPQYKTEIMVAGNCFDPAWSDSASPKLLGKGDGEFKGALVMDGTPEFKFIHDGSWIGGTAGEAGSYTLGANDNMTIAAGTYFWTVNLAQNTASATQITKVELMGSFDSWGSGIELTFDSASKIYTGEVTLSDGAEIKVRFNGDWGYAMAGTLDRLSAVADGNIAVATGGSYKISLDLNKGTLTLTNK